ncbi:MAG: hypothetical protein M1832_004215 [Thelocarpon impressellum]|nr:MAG: hypothetical protein M1832_004215 [Thelocarpon impressellum]
MSSYKTSLLAAALAFASTIDAHMILKTPAPFGNPNSSPLLPDGSDYPCKMAGGAAGAAGPGNAFPLGSSQELSFTGSAVHGGGSCQVSITYDSPPTKDSVFKVIESIEGGCPANAPGNLPEDPAGSGAGKFKYTIPAELPGGNATLAWTWFNKIGNREMYMNCASVALGGGAGSGQAATNPFFTGLPDMFKANIGGDCKTTEGSDLAFPNPGASVQKAGSGATAPPTGSCAGGSGSGGSGGPSGAVPIQGGNKGLAPSGGSGGGSSPTATGAPTPASSAPAASAPVAAPSAPASASKPVQKAPVNGVAPGSAAPSGSSGTGSGSGGTTTTCDASSVGKTLCNGTGKIGTCDQGGKVAWIEVASGTVCKDGFMVASRRARFGRRDGRDLARRYAGTTWA